MPSRRTLLKTTLGASLALPLFRISVLAAEDWRQAAATSPLIYLTPLKSDGAESQCKAEIWFALHDQALHVVTSASAWRSQAIARGLTGARIWIGDVGQWKKSDGAYRKLLQVETRARVESDPKAQAAVLAVMSEKYADGWDRWGPRFDKGLADGSRVMLRYDPIA